MNIRAAAVRCICPPDNFTPRGPTIVSRPSSSVGKSVSMTPSRIERLRASQSHGNPMRMLSLSFSLKSFGVWGVYAQRGGTKNAFGSSTISPFQRISPACFGRTPKSVWISVVLPEPICPVTTVNEPAGIFKSTSVIPVASPL